MTTPPPEAASAGGEVASPETATHPVGSALFSAWKYSSETVAKLSQSIDLAPYQKQVNSYSVWGYRIASRIFKPYPYGSVTAIVDFLATEGVAAADSIRPEVAHTDADLIPQHPLYRRACSNLCAQWIDRIPQWQDLVNKDAFNPYPEDKELVATLRQVITFMRFSEDTSKIERVLATYLNELIKLPDPPYRTEKVMELTQICLGQMMQNTNLIAYQDFLVKLIRTSAKTLYQSDQAMRYLGVGLAETGRTKMRMKKTQAKDLVALYAVLLEGEDPSERMIPFRGRSLKMPIFRELLAGDQKQKASGSDATLSQTIKILDNNHSSNRGRRHTLTIYATELASDLFPAEYVLQLPLFDLCSANRQTHRVDLFEVAFAEGVEAAL